LPSRILREDSGLKAVSMETIADIAVPERSAKPVNRFAAEWLALLECARPRSDSQYLSELLRRNIAWPSLLKLADEHGMLGLLGDRLRTVNEAEPPAEVRRQLRDWQRAQIIFTLSLTAELFHVLDRFAATGIEILLTKGPVLSARCYGDAGSRQYTDLDLIARDEDIERATEVMIALGYDAKVPLKAIRARKFPGEYVFVRPDTKHVVEFHTERTFRYHPRPLSVEKLFQRRAYVSFDGHSVPALSVEDELMLICIHGAKHFWTRLMWIADVAALVSRQDVDWKRASSSAREVGAERMLRLGLQLAADVVGARLPTEIVDEVSSDVAAARMAAEISRRLPLGETMAIGLFGRAVFRAKMRGGFLSGAAYLLRLSLSPTEEDWVAGAEGERASLLEAAGRPFRLARKHGRNGRA
jgi:hypothetical protein